jgi:hypothetical protein
MPDRIGYPGVDSQAIRAENGGKEGTAIGKSVKVASSWIGLPTWVLIIQ